ncbi:MAG: hypothetical protein ABJB78_00105 [Betaproteobacteria bacterium]
MTPKPPGAHSLLRSLALAIAAAVLAVGAEAAVAQSTQYGNIVRIHVRSSDGLVYFYVGGPRSAQPACASQPYWVIAGESTNAGKQQLALVMMAEAAGKSVIITGTGSCARWPDGETVLEVAVSD